MTMATQGTDLFAQMTGTAVEMFTLCADVNQKVLRELVDLSASAAKEGVRLYAELQSSAVEAVKDGQTYALRRQTDCRTRRRTPSPSASAACRSRRRARSEPSSSSRAMPRR